MSYLIKTLRVFKYVFLTTIYTSILLIVGLYTLSKYNNYIPANYLSGYIKNNFKDADIHIHDISLSLKKLGNIELILTNNKINYNNIHINAPRIDVNISLIDLVTNRSNAKNIHVYDANINIKNNELGGGDYKDLDLLLNKIINTRFVLEKSRVVLNNKQASIVGDVAFLSLEAGRKNNIIYVNSIIQCDINNKKIDLTVHVNKEDDEVMSSLNFRHLDSDLIKLIYTEQEEKFRSIGFTSEAQIKSKINIKDKITHKESSIEIKSARGDYFNHEYYPTKKEFTGNASILVHDDIVLINNIDLNIDNININGKGDVNFETYDNNFRLKINSNIIDVDQLHKYIPDIWSDMQYWLKNNVRSGAIKDIGGIICIKDSELLLVDVNTNVENIDVDVSEDLDTIKNIYGKIHFSENDINIEVDASRLGNMSLSGDVHIQDITKSEAMIFIQGEAEGMVEDVNHAYPKINEDVSLNLSEIKNGVIKKADFKINAPLNNPDDAEYSFQANIQDIIISNILEDITFKGVDIEVSHSNYLSTIKGDATLDDYPVELDIAYDDEGILYKANGEIEAKHLDKIGIFQDVSGSIGFDAEGKIDSNNIHCVKSKLDIMNTAFKFNELNIKKDLGVVGEVDLDVVVEGDNHVIIKNIDIETESLTLSNLSGEVYDDEYNIILQNINSTNNNFTIVAQKNRENSILEIYGQVVDLSNIDISNLNYSGYASNSTKTRVFVDKIIMKNNIFYNNADFNLDCANADCSYGYFKAMLNNKHKIGFTYKDDEILFASDNAGLFLKSLNLIDTLENGYIRAYFDLKEEAKYPGEIIINNFRMTKAPILASILSIASFEGLINTLNGNGIFFQKLYIKFDYAEGILSVRKSLAEGISLGITTHGDIDLNKKLLLLEGTVIPFYMVNKTIEMVPVIGRLITGEGEGLIFGTDYSVDGDISNPAISTNPLTTLAPGFLRKFLRISKPKFAR